VADTVALDKLLGEVTTLVLKAEGSFRDTISCYRALEHAESAIASHPDATPLDRDIATRGAANAARILALLEGGARG
jgi:hypothetical protein